MALTPDQIDALPEYTPAQHLKMWKLADIELSSSGVAVMANGRSLTRADAAEVTEKIEYWTQRVQMDNAGPAGFGNILVNMDNP